MSDTFMFRFDGVRYIITLCNVLYGMCFRRGNESEIVLSCKKIPKKLLENAIHESLHAEIPELDENTVERCGKEMSNFLWKLGFRLPKNMVRK